MHLQFLEPGNHSLSTQRSIISNNAKEKATEEEMTIMKHNYKLLRCLNSHDEHYIGPNVSGCSYILHWRDYVYSFPPGSDIFSQLV